MKGDAALNMKLFRSIGGEIFECGNNPKVVSEGLKDADIIVDAIFGTGLSKEVKGKERLAIEAMNRSGNQSLPLTYRPASMEQGCTPWSGREGHAYLYLRLSEAGSDYLSGGGLHG